MSLPENDVPAIQLAAKKRRQAKLTFLAFLFAGGFIGFLYGFCTI